MKNIILLLFLLLPTRLLSQTVNPNVEFAGNKIQVLQAKENGTQVTGKLTTGEIIKTGCDHGACYFRIDYKGRSIEQNIGDAIAKMTIYEYDFGGDGDNEIVAVNSLFETSYIFIYSYSKGIIKKLFEKEILSYRIVLKKDHIEYYMPGGLDQVWNYYQGRFWVMNPVDEKKFIVK